MGGKAQTLVGEFLSFISTSFSPSHMPYAPIILPPSFLFLKLEPSKEQRRYPGYWTHPRCLPNPTEGFQLGVRTNGITSSYRKAMSSYQLSIYASVSVTCLFFSPTLGSSCYLLEFGFQGPCLIFASSTEEVPDNALSSPSSRSQYPGQGGQSLQIPGNTGAHRALYCVISLEYQARDGDTTRKNLRGSCRVPASLVMKNGSTDFHL